MRGSRPIRLPMSDAATTRALVQAPSGPLVVPDSPPGEPSRIHFSLVIPTFNESKNIGVLIPRLVELFEPVLGADRFELVVVDDDSPDLTWQSAAELAATYPVVRVLRRQGERGLSSAVIRGWQVARGDVIGVMDADLQHPPEINLQLLREIEKGADLAAGSRHVEGGGVSDWSLIRRILSRGAEFIGLIILPGVLSRVSDPMSGYFMLRRSAISNIVLDPLGYKILIEVVARGRMRWIGEVGYVFRERTEGESKVTWRLYIEYLRHLLKLRWATLPESRLFRFCVVGASGVLVDMSLLYVLSDPSMFALGLTRSKIIAAEAALTWNFLINDIWTFRDSALQKPGLQAKLRRFIAFNIICSLGIALNVLLLNLLFNYAHVNRYVANGIAILIVTGWNFWLNQRLNWTPAAGASKDGPR
jgi:dolichol-phosphate mannosyltransferase